MKKGEDDYVGRPSLSLGAAIRDRVEVGGHRARAAGDGEDTPLQVVRVGVIVGCLRERASVLEGRKIGTQ